MTDRDDLHARLHTLEARAAIADLVHRYALFIRRGRHAECEALFTADGSFETRDADPAQGGAFTVRASVEGRAAVMDYIRVSAGSGLRIMPMIRNLLITVDGDSATASSLMASRTWPAGREIFGEYEDHFRNEDGWRFARRVFTIYQKPA